MRTADPSADGRRCAAGDISSRRPRGDILLYTHEAKATSSFASFFLFKLSGFQQLLRVRPARIIAEVLSAVFDLSKKTLGRRPFNDQPVRAGGLTPQPYRPNKSNTGEVTQQEGPLRPGARFIKSYDLS